jgi:hypothetical protein
LEEARRRQVEIDRPAVLEEMTAQRTQRGLLRQRELAAWLDENGTSGREYQTLALESRLARAGAALSPLTLARHVVAELKWSGEFAALARRARDKARLLADRQGEADPHDPRPGDLALVLWHFEARLGEPVPQDLDGYARALGLEGRRDLYRVLAREHVYSGLRQHVPKEDGSA